MFGPYKFQDNTYDIKKHCTPLLEIYKTKIIKLLVFNVIVLKLNKTLKQECKARHYKTARNGISISVRYGTVTGTVRYGYGTVTSTGKEVYTPLIFWVFHLMLFTK